MFVFIYRAFKFAFQGFIRNFWLSLVTIVILVLTLFSITMVAGINFVADRTVDSVKNKIDVSIYFKSDVAEDNVIEVKNKIDALSMVKSINYVSKEEALDKFREKHKNEPLILESIEALDDNPLSATLIVKANDIEDYDEIMKVVEDPEYSEMIESNFFDDNQKVINQLSGISKKVERVGIIVSGIFIIIAVLIIFNTIRINIYTHREEIGIMKLVGATNMFVRAPFIIESLIYAIISVIICIAIIFPLLGVIAPQVNEFFDGYNLDLVNYFNTNFWKIIGLQLGFAIILSILSSSIAIGRYLRV